MLLHIATHDMSDALPRTTTARAIDLAAASAGVLVVLAGGSEHGHASEHHGLGPLVLSLALRFAPALLIAMVGMVVSPNRADGPRFLDKRGLVAAAFAATTLRLDAAAPLVLGLLAMAAVWPTAPPRSARVASKRLEPWSLGLASAGALGLFGAAGIACAAFVELAFHEATRGAALELGGAAVVAFAAALHPVTAVAPAAYLTDLGVSSPFLFGGLVAGVAARGAIDRARRHGRVAPSSRPMGVLGVALGVGAAAALVALRTDRPLVPPLQIPAAIGWASLLGGAGFVLAAAFAIGARGLVSGLVSAVGKKPGCHDHDWGEVHWDHAHPKPTR
ncbi:MAG: hypothetical protein U0414_28105 [Polyangiaceae bacterium]